MVLFNKLPLLSLLGPYLHRQIQFIGVDFSSAPQSAHQARTGKTVTRYASVQQGTKTVIQSQEDVLVCLATMETTVSSVSTVCAEVGFAEEIAVGQTIIHSKGCR